mmetsp:Transcript_23242/g.28814  ORF Transcript_23242/g.28814 Transcript_23242/m.28814 type:complete len:136 (-) Transcript_23242:780-1187(-)
MKKPTIAAPSHPLLPSVQESVSVSVDAQDPAPRPTWDTIAETERGITSDVTTVPPVVVMTTNETVIETGIVEMTADAATVIVAMTATAEVVMTATTGSGASVAVTSAHLDAIGVALETEAPHELPLPTLGSAWLA